jgi:hypothetical protein
LPNCTTTRQQVLLDPAHEGLLVLVRQQDDLAFEVEDADEQDDHQSANDAEVNVLGRGQGRALPPGHGSGGQQGCRAKQHNHSEGKRQKPQRPAQRLLDGTTLHEKLPPTGAPEHPKGGAVGRPAAANQ